MQLIQFKRNEEENSIHLKFENGFESDITLKELRDNCPCATCSGEQILLHKYVPEKQKISNLGYTLDRAEPVGTYAIKLIWRDKHDTGIYSWEYLRKLAEKK
jgi:DUF971 family protein